MKLKKKTAHTPVGKVKNLLSSLFDRNVDKRTKWMVIGVVAYILSPIDLVPDFVPVAGYIDDVLLPVILFVVERMISAAHEKNQLEG